jgi:hypothetical protein
MYRLVGCTDCSALWIVADQPERTNCPRCDRSHQLSALRAFVETEDKDHAREVRASMLATRQDEDEAFAALDHVEEMEAQLDDAGVDDETYLADSGLDPEAVSDAAKQATESNRSSQNRRQIVLSAVEELSTPTEEAIVSYATDRDVSASFVRTALEKFRRQGELTLDGETYRRL